MPNIRDNHHCILPYISGQFSADACQTGGSAVLEQVVLVGVAGGGGS
jgi:hypothetical protein